MMNHTESSPQKVAASTLETPSNISLAIKNLQFLNLDTLPDWPSLTDSSFRVTGKDYSTQRDRVRKAEWVLYRLFEIWDSKETKLKLDSFFPALEPFQSIKLRTNLLQWLTQLKSNGLLGRECAMRKSLLDECKGEKFEELLFAFSAVVLQEVFVKGAQKKAHVPIAQQFGLQKNLDHEDTEITNALELAHRYRLQQSVASRADFKGKFSELSEILEAGELEQNLKKARVEAELKSFRAESKIPGADSTIIKKQLRHECAGDPKWLSILISGDSDQGRDVFMEDRFSAIWERAIDSKDIPWEDVPKGTIEDLAERLKRQQSRLADWRAFQQEISQRNEELVAFQSPVKTPLKSPQKGSLNSSRRNSPRKALTSPSKRLRTPATNSRPSYPIQPSSDKVVANGAIKASQKLARITSPVDGNGSREYLSDQLLDPKVSLHDTQRRFRYSPTSQSNQEDRNLDETPGLSLLNLESSEDSPLFTKYTERNAIASQHGEFSHFNFPLKPALDESGLKGSNTLSERTRQSLAFPMRPSYSSRDQMIASPSAQTETKKLDTDTLSSRALESLGSLQNRTTQFNRMQHQREASEVIRANSSVHRQRGHRKSKSVQNKYPVNPFEADNSLTASGHFTPGHNFGAAALQDSSHSHQTLNDEIELQTDSDRQTTNDDIKDERECPDISEVRLASLAIKNDLAESHARSTIFDQAPTPDEYQTPNTLVMETESGKSTKVGDSTTSRAAEQSSTMPKTPPETIFADDADAASVFKKRSKLRRSPPPTIGGAYQ